MTLLPRKYSFWIVEVASHGHRRLAPSHRGSRDTLSTAGTNVAQLPKAPSGPIPRWLAAAAMRPMSKQPPVQPAAVPVARVLVEAPDRPWLGLEASGREGGEGDPGQRTESGDGDGTASGSH